VVDVQTLRCTFWDRRDLIMTRKKSLRSQLYRAARDLGNVEAASQGPTSFGERYARRKVYAKTNGFTRKLLRSFGLSK
jgi:hypothetical protein